MRKRGDRKERNGIPWGIGKEEFWTYQSKMPFHGVLSSFLIDLLKLIDR
jgi:hypothetical protein